MKGAALLLLLFLPFELRPQSSDVSAELFYNEIALTIGARLETGQLSGGSLPISPELAAAACGTFESGSETGIGPFARLEWSPQGLVILRAGLSLGTLEQSQDFLCREIADIRTGAGTTEAARTRFVREVDATQIGFEIGVGYRLADRWVVGADLIGSGFIAGDVRTSEEVVTPAGATFVDGTDVRDIGSEQATGEPLHVTGRLSLRLELPIGDAISFRPEIGATYRPAFSDDPHALLGFAGLGLTFSFFPEQVDQSTPLEPLDE